MGLPEAYCPQPLRSGTGPTDYLIRNVGRILCPLRWSPGWDTEAFVDTMVSQVAIWQGHGYPGWLTGVAVRWDYTGGAVVEMPDDKMIAWGSAAEQFEFDEEAFARGGDYAYPGQVFDADTRRYVWPTQGSKKVLHRARYFERLQTLRVSEGLVPVPRGRGGVALDPRTTWAWAAERTADLLARCGAGWLVHYGNKTRHFHAAGEPGQGFLLRMPWSLAEFYDAIADYYRAVQRHRPGVRILKVELPDPTMGKSEWLENRGVKNVWIHGPKTGRAVPLGLGPPT